MCVALDNQEDGDGRVTVVGAGQQRSAEEIYFFYSFLFGDLRVRLKEEQREDVCGSDLYYSTHEYRRRWVLGLHILQDVYYTTPSAPV